MLINFVYYFCTKQSFTDKRMDPPLEEVAKPEVRSAALRVEALIVDAFLDYTGEVDTVHWALFVPT